MRKNYKKHKNSSNYWDFQSIYTSISSIISEAAAHGLIKENIAMKKLKNNCSLLEYLHETIAENYDSYSSLQKSVADNILFRINSLHIAIYKIIEELFGLTREYIEQITILDPSGIAVDRIKNKIKLAVERYNGKWTTFVRRIRTDIFRELKKLKNGSVPVCFSSSLPEEDVRDEECLTQNRMYIKRKTIEEQLWDAHYYMTPEDYVIAKEMGMVEC